MERDRLVKSDLLALGILAGLGLVLGVYLILSAPLIANDGVFYIEQARRISSDPAAVIRRHPPGYPFLLWAAHALVRPFAAGDSAILWARSAQGLTLLCRLLALVPLYFLGKRLVGPRDSFLALLVLVVLPYPARYGSDVLREWPYVLFLSLGLWMLYRGLQEGTRWPFAVAGLAAGLGYLIRPECAQLLIYGLLGLVLLAPGSLRWSRHEVCTPSPPHGHRLRTRCGAALLLITGFALPAAPSISIIGTIVPQQLLPSTANAPPVILRVGSRPAGGEPLEFEVRAGELLEVPLEAFDPEDRPLTLSLVGVPIDSRPVYQFRSPATGARFWTLSEDERSTLLTTHSPPAWQYDGVAWYAYARPDPPAGLQPVHRFWSAAQQRHEYAIGDADTATRHDANDWQYEGVAFYAFPTDHHPPDAVPVYQLGSAGRSADSTRDGNPPSEIVSPQPHQAAWYAHGAGQPPAGATVDNLVLRWRPRPDQQGEHQINLVVSDGRNPTCQLVKIRIHSPEQKPPITNHKSEVKRDHQYAGWAQLPQAGHQLFDALAEDFMVVFLVPWLLGLYYRLCYQARPRAVRNSTFEFRDSGFGLSDPERVLVPALLAVNIAAMLARHAWIAPGDNRRYSLGLLALTIFYIPTGLQLLAAWLTRILRIYDLRFRMYDLLASLRIVRPRPQINDHESIITHHRSQRCGQPRRTSIWGRRLPYVLLAVGIGICVLRFFMAPSVDKSSYRVMARWLRANTAPGAVIAVPDIRISFYADRPGLLYRRRFDPRQADYAVKLEDQDRPNEIRNPKPEMRTSDFGISDPAFAGWRREHAIPFNRGQGGKALVAYRIGRAGRS